MGLFTTNKTMLNLSNLLSYWNDPSPDKKQLF